VGSDTIEFQVIELPREDKNWVHMATAHAEAAQVEERQSNEMILANASEHVMMARIVR
jgi:RNA:NAD 2'-phosphotransferase (TPT1/KptA family)